jgi:hypothetical protein
MDPHPPRPIQLVVSVTRAPQRAAPPTPSFLDIVRALTAFLAGVAWPIVVLAGLLLFRAPVRSLVTALGDRVNLATKFSAGSLSFEVQRTAEAIGNPELGSLVSGLSPGAVEKLLTLGNVSWVLVGSHTDPNTFTLPSDREMSALRELESKGLAHLTRPLDEWMAILRTLPLQRDNSPVGERVVYRAKHALASEESKQLSAQSVSLTALGHHALDLVVQTIVGAIGRPR